MRFRHCMIYPISSKYRKKKRKRRFLYSSMDYVFGLEEIYIGSKTAFGVAEFLKQRLDTRNACKSFSYQCIGIYKNIY